MKQSSMETGKSFSVCFGCDVGGITSLKRSGDLFDTDYIMQGQALGEVIVRYRVHGQSWREASTRTSEDVREISASNGCTRFLYDNDSANKRGIRDFKLSEQFRLRPQSLIWEFTISNRTPQTLELGDIALPLLMNTAYVKDPETTYTRRLVKHSFISGHGSFIYWNRCNGVGPYLVMTPLDGTKLEYFQVLPKDPNLHAWEGPYHVYIHSAVNGAGETRGSWRQPHTSKVLSRTSPKSESNSNLIHSE